LANPSRDHAVAVISKDPNARAAANSFPCSKRKKGTPSRITLARVWRYICRDLISGVRCMLNLFFPFLNLGSQPAPKAETASPADPRAGPEMEMPERGGADPVPEEHPRARRRKNGRSSKRQARKAADQTGTGQIVAGQHRTERPEQAEARSTNQVPGSIVPEFETTPQAQDPVRVEATRPAPTRVERGIRTGRWGTTAHDRTGSASSLPAGQRWKRRLPPASRR